MQAPCLGSLAQKDLQANTAEKLRWKRFKSQPGGIDKIHQLLVHSINIYSGQLQAYVWSQDLVENSNIPDSFKLGWLCDAGKILVPTLSDIAITLESVVELDRCGCGISKCSRRCSCR